ncbi:hypothetical protein LVY72_20890, partial [Arthrobacter sp. I2-34]|nr:hypothetical protein [Arthrobacter hankyongi]
TVNHLLSDLGSLPAATHPEEEELVQLLDRRGIEYTTWDGWLRLDAHEKELGEAAGTMETARGPVIRERIKVVPRDQMVALSRPAGAAAAQAGSALSASYCSEPRCQ